MQNQCPSRGRAEKEKKGEKRRRRDKERKVADCPPLLLVRER
jgi:hypothetical protein